MNVTDDPLVVGLLARLGIDIQSQPIKPNRFVRAASPIQIVREQEGKRVLQTATWWLLLEPSEKGFKPSRYTSFNTRYDKLNVPRSAGYHPYRKSRCIIPARGFGETEFEYKGKKKVPKYYHDMVAKDCAIAFAGLCRDYICKDTGEVTTGCSVITLPPHPKLKDIHTKASPMMLPQDITMDDWLDAGNEDVEMFAHLLEPNIRHDLETFQIDKPSSHNSVGKAFTIHSD
ncbi:SOS response-associated peptidase family protein [Alteromonas gilva]|uniref:SOS response-associated peptidase family protein n=1 Tax=Alteromonas gilva TaxID=2987522 RepID=UPI0035ABE44E